MNEWMNEWLLIFGIWHRRPAASRRSWGSPHHTSPQSSSPYQYTSERTPTNESSSGFYLAFLPKTPLKSRTIHDPHARIRPIMASQHPTSHPLSPLSQHVRRLPHHNHQLATHLQQRGQRGFLSELQTHVRRTDESAEDGHLRGQKRVFADHRLHFAQNQMKRVGFRPFCLLFITKSIEPRRQVENSVRPMYQFSPIRSKFQFRSGLLRKPALVPNLSVWCTTSTTPITLHSLRFYPHWSRPRTKSFGDDRTRSSLSSCRIRACRSPCSRARSSWTFPSWR